MPLFLFFASSFERSLKNLDPQQKAVIARIIESLEIYYSSGCNIAKVLETEARFFYKKLRHDFYEAGVEGKLRIVLRKDGSK
ncbi:MAG: hypothetical protein HQL15_09515 [Candidatus Omnitrophica bacterium]|nr:hypothetical protein [Candidatus Omnitrophota bacterium]